MMPPFHLALPVDELERARSFYGGLLGCREGRSHPRWIDFDFWGHQLTVHLRPEECRAALTNEVDGDAVPVRHFGLILAWEDWEQLAQRLAGRLDFILEPHIRFQGKVGEQATMFFRDPAGNAIEIKSFKDTRMIFARATPD